MSLFRIRTVRRFMTTEAIGGWLLFVTTIVALVVDNTSLRPYYEALFSMPFTVQLSHWSISKPLLLWVNEGLMVVFFMMVGLEIKREMLEGELKGLPNVLLPAVVAVGGMAIPALIYIAFNYHNPVALRGWAIPTPTDIAFALAVLACLGDRIPLSLKLFLTAVAIFDDIGAIIVIAVFYTAEISAPLLAVSALLVLVLVLLNRFNVIRRAPYFLVGLGLWACVLNSGVHATLAGIILAFAIPIRKRNDASISPLRDLEQGLLPWVAFLVLPIFAFANTGISFEGISWNYFLHSIPLGIALGLLVGKQIGIFGTTWLMVKNKLAPMPHNTTWKDIYGVSLVAGIGFTMSLFIGGLAFGYDNVEHGALVRMGIMSGSLVSGILGYGFLRWGRSE